MQELTSKTAELGKPKFGKNKASHLSQRASLRLPLTSICLYEYVFFPLLV